MNQVYFFVRQEKSNSKYSISFQFESDELVHNMNSTVRMSWMESWLEKYLLEKQMTREILFLATEVSFASLLSSNPLEYQILDSNHSRK